MELQPQVPPVQVMPVPQGGFAPHLQPPAVQLSALVPQLVQLAPPVPQALVVLPALQVVPLQHPAQVTPSQTQEPLTQWRLPVQALLLPQRQLPPDEQLSAVLLLQPVQLCPLVPQLLKVGGLTQLPPLQQPLGQLVESQTQLPETQCRPLAHWLLAPQRQLPPVLQESARMGSQAKQEAPLVPHWAAVVGLTQVLPLQQPLGQVVELHPVQAWPTQVKPVPQAAHAAPPVPHSPFAVPALQMLPAQQPVGQLVESQMQAPAEHTCPAPQGAPAPQAQPPLVQRSVLAGSHAVHAAPDEPQALALCAPVERQVLLLQQPAGHELALQTQLPPEHVWPAAQAAPVPQRQTPEVQVLVEPEHGPQAAPAVPQVEALWLPKGMHWPALQQPLGHEVESQTHAPPRHRCPGAQAAPVPHWQVPAVAEQRSAVGPQLRQVAPPRPHWLWVVGVTQVVPLQQPLAHELALHTQAPATHAWPAAQAAPEPQRQAPLVQLSASVALHAVHTAPEVPQAEKAGVMQMPLAQQPEGQATALQPEHACAVQLCPAGHA